MGEIKVKVTKYDDRRFWIMYYDDPMSGKRQTRSTGKETKHEAEREAAKWEGALREGRYKPASNITWADFRQRYEDEVLASLAERTDRTVGTVFNMVERILRPQRLRDLTADRLSYFQQELRKGAGQKSGQKKRKDGRSEATVKTYLAHLKGGLRWAVDMGMLAEVPKVKMPKRAKGSKVMKGRPITCEEFERMLEKTEPVVGDKAAPSWRHYLEGLWLSGLRLGESLSLFWDGHEGLVLDFDVEYPMLRIPAECEKGNRDRLLPLAPDFAEFLTRTPEDERTGRVFRVLGMRGKRECTDEDWISRIVGRIGEAAGVVVNREKQNGKDEEVKYASAHDLRRSFGERWARDVMPKVLQELMRHETIDTTMKFYVGHNAQATADVLWKVHRKHSVQEVLSDH